MYFFSNKIKKLKNELSECNLSKTNLTSKLIELNDKIENLKKLNNDNLYYYSKTNIANELNRCNNELNGSINTLNSCENALIELYEKFEKYKNYKNYKNRGYM